MRCVTRFLLVAATTFVWPSLAHADDVKVSREAMQAAVNYLATKPYQEVYQIILPLIAAQPADVPKPEHKPEESK